MPYYDADSVHTTENSQRTNGGRYGITQYYLPPGRGDIPAVTPAEAGTRLSDPEGMEG